MIIYVGQGCNGPAKNAYKEKWKMQTSDIFDKNVRFLKHLGSLERLINA